MMNKNFTRYILLPLAIALGLISYSYAAIDMNLKFGMNNNQVLELQNFLKDRGYLKAAPNGNFGPATLSAVKALQKANGLPQVGQVGPATRAIVNKSSNTSTNNPINNTPSPSNSNNQTNNYSNFPANIQNIMSKSFTVGAWVPYWREKEGSQQIIDNISKVDIVSPFSYEMNGTGSFSDPMKMGSGAYAEMIKVAKQNGKLAVPSILWWAVGAERDNLDIVMKDDYLRSYLIELIEKEVAKYDLDGIDIDFENKKAETRDDFSKFLEELSRSMRNKNKLLICTIEARTPSSTEFVNGTDPQSELARSNDFKRIGNACDQVRIMAYDQDRADKDLNNIKGVEYKPVSDIDWVKKVLTLTMRDIEWKKISLGVPTYGNKYSITRNAAGQVVSYNKIGSMNWFYADEEARNRGITPKRDSTGELSYTYFDTAKNQEFMVVYSDAESIKEKADLAKLYGVGGITIFKIDGNNDKSVWSKI